MHPVSTSRRLAFLHRAAILHRLAILHRVAVLHRASILRRAALHWVATLDCDGQDREALSKALAESMRTAEPCAARDNKAAEARAAAARHQAAGPEPDTPAVEKVQDSQLDAGLNPGPHAAPCVLTGLLRRNFAGPRVRRPARRYTCLPVRKARHTACRNAWPTQRRGANSSYN